MNTNLSRVLDILYAAEIARKEGCRRVCELLSLDPTSTIARILIEPDNGLGPERFIPLLQDVSRIVGKHGVRRNIADWTFG